MHRRRHLKSNAPVPAQTRPLYRATNTTHASTSGPSTVVTDRVPGSFLSPDAGLRRITGKVKVLNAHTLSFDDGTEVELKGGIEAPELDQKGLIGDAFYPCHVSPEMNAFLRRSDRYSC
jgi:hypothetical protein